MFFLSTVTSLRSPYPCLGTTLLHESSGADNMTAYSWWWNWGWFICLQRCKKKDRKNSFFFFFWSFSLHSSFTISSPPPYRWSQAAFNNPMHSHASTPQATPLMLHYSHTYTRRQCQFPRQDPCLSSPDWISLVQYGAVTLGLRALHGPAGSYIGLKLLGLQWKKALGLDCVIFWWWLLLLLHKLEWPHVFIVISLSLVVWRRTRADTDN